VEVGLLADIYGGFRSALPTLHLLQKVLPDVYFLVQEYSIYGCYNAFMNIFTNVSTNQAAILGRTIIPDDQEMPEDMARFLIGIRLTEQDTKRMNELVAKVREGNLAPDEEHEIEDYRHVGHLLEAIKSKARITLRKASHSG
jgi:hypothetical protein